MSNKNVIFLLLILSILLVVVPSGFFVQQTHDENLWLVVQKEVIEAANKCKNEDKCQNNTVTLNYLITNNYLNKVYDPITKEAINDNSYVDFSTNEFKIIK